MKKVEVISRNQKDQEKQVSSLDLKPSERIINMFRLMELSYYLRGGKNEFATISDKSKIIELKLINGTK
jgi:hypothetical protein